MQEIHCYFNHIYYYHTAVDKKIIGVDTTNVSHYGMNTKRELSRGRRIFFYQVKVRFGKLTIFLLNLY